MDNKDFFNEQDKQQEECKKHTNCEECPNKGICLLMNRSEVSIFNYARQDIFKKIKIVKDSMEAYYTVHDVTDPYSIGLHNGMESVIALLENRMAIHKAGIEKPTFWDKILNFFAKEKI